MNTDKPTVDAELESLQRKTFSYFLGFVEERILLLVAQHFYGGFAENGEKERGFFRRGIGA
jgi:hypothetical protein